MNVDLWSSGEDRCSFYCTAVGTVTKGSGGGNLFGWRTKDETGVTGYVRRKLLPEKKKGRILT